MITEARIIQFLNGEATGDSTDYMTPVIETDNIRYQFYFEIEDNRLLLQINANGSYGGSLRLNLETVDHLAKVFNAARAVMAMKGK